LGIIIRTLCTSLLYHIIYSVSSISQKLSSII
jgi:hypothetical protein